MSTTRIRAAALVGAGAALSAALTGCSAVSPTPPFVYEDLVVMYGEVPDCHRALGLHVVLRNVGDRRVERFTHSFNIYDAEGNRLGEPGSYGFTATVTADLAPGEADRYCSSLDAALHFIPQRGLQVGQYRITELRFADGSRWAPLPGLYSYPYPAREEEAQEPNVDAHAQAAGSSRGASAARREAAS
jgi:hypothetical protein